MKAISILTVMTVAAVFGGSILPSGVLKKPSAHTRPDSAVRAEDSAQPPSFPAGSATSVPQRELGDQSAVGTPPVEKAESSGSQLLGLVVSESRTALQAITSGVLRKLPVEQGSLVNTGEQIAGIDDTEIVAACKRQQSQVDSAKALVKEAELRLRHAQYTYDKTRRVYEKRAGSEAELVEARFAVQSAEVKLEAAAAQVTAEEHQLVILQRQVEKHRVLAPFSGTVTEILRHPHQYVGEGETILWMESQRRQLKVHVPPSLLGKLKDLRFSLSSETDGTQLSVGTMKPSLNPDGSRTVLLELPATSAFLPGQIVGVLAKLPEGTK